MTRPDYLGTELVNKAFISNSLERESKFDLGGYVTYDWQSRTTLKLAERRNLCDCSVPNRNSRSIGVVSGTQAAAL